MQINKGVILGLRDSDWKAGAISGITYKEELPSGDWTPYLPLEEWQWKENGFDTMACVTFSALSILETLYFFHTGRQLNFSDRFTATLSGTSPTGNYLWKVGDSIRKDGLALEQEWAMIENPTWETYYAMPPIEVINEAKKFLNDWQVNYEFIDFTKESLLQHLKQAPIQAVIPGHAVMLFSTTEQVYKYFDSYNPFIKERSEGFITAMKYVIIKKNKMEHIKIENDQYIIIPEIKFAYSIANPEILFQLQTNGLGNTPEDKQSDYLSGYLIIKGSTDAQIRDMFNLK